MPRIVWASLNSFYRCDVLIALPILLEDGFALRRYGKVLEAVEENLAGEDDTSQFVEYLNSIYPLYHDGRLWEVALVLDELRGMFRLCCGIQNTTSMELHDISVACLVKFALEASRKKDYFLARRLITKAKEVTGRKSPSDIPWRRIVQIADAEVFFRQNKLRACVAMLDKVLSESQALSFLDKLIVKSNKLAAGASPDVCRDIVQGFVSCISSWKRKCSLMKVDISGFSPGYSFREHVAERGVCFSAYNLAVVQSSMIGKNEDALSTLNDASEYIFRYDLSSEDVGKRFIRLKKQLENSVDSKAIDIGIRTPRSNKKSPIPKRSRAERMLELLMTHSHLDDNLEIYEKSVGPSSEIPRRKMVKKKRRKKKKNKMENVSVEVVEKEQVLEKNAPDPVDEIEESEFYATLSSTQEPVQQTTSHGYWSRIRNFIRSKRSP